MRVQHVCTHCEIVVLSVAVNSSMFWLIFVCSFDFVCQMYLWSVICRCMAVRESLRSAVLCGALQIVEQLNGDDNR